VWGVYVATTVLSGPRKAHSRSMRKNSPRMTTGEPDESGENVSVINREQWLRAKVDGADHRSVGARRVKGDFQHTGLPAKVLEYRTRDDRERGTGARPERDWSAAKEIPRSAAGAPWGSGGNPKKRPWGAVGRAVGKTLRSAMRRRTVQRSAWDSQALPRGIFWRLEGRNDA
jgi:hypothetical protein